MTQNLDSLDNLIKTGAKSAIKGDTPFNTVVGGEIVEVSTRQAREFSRTGDGKLKTWDDGNPMMEIVVIVQTAIREDAEDNGRRGFYIKTWGSQKRALTDAVRKSGKSKLSEALAPGGKFYGQVTGTQATKSGYDEKLWAFKVEPREELDVAFDTPEDAAPTTDNPYSQASAAQAPQGYPQQDQRPAGEKTPQQKAQAMLDAGFDAATIAQTVGLTEAEVNAL